MPPSACLGTPGRVEHKSLMINSQDECLLSMQEYLYVFVGV